MHWHSYLRSSAEIIRLYDGAIPLAAWLKNYFRQYKKFGSKDRKLISDLCFCYYRLGPAFKAETTEEQLMIGQFLCHEKSGAIQTLRPEWAAKANSSLQEKLSLLRKNDSYFFPFLSELSKEIEPGLFDESHLVQPDLFLRIRRGKKQAVIQKLKDAGVNFIGEGDSIRLPNSTRIEEIIELDREVVVQDKSSQQVLNLLRVALNKEEFTTWDCCAASGGKTILLHDQFPKAQLTVSDIRESILHNLHARFRRAGIRQFQSFVADVSSPAFSSSQKFDVIICDAPCSGSGTWGRTPEQLYFFPKEKIDDYSKLQKAIAVNVSKSLKQGGFFLYITCSVFYKENEEVVEIILQNTDLTLVKTQYMKGYTEKADTLFTALFRL